MPCAAWEWRDAAAGDGGARFLLRLLGRFQLRVGGHDRALGASAQRLLAVLAIHREGTRRSRAAGLLWPDVPAGRAAANLRSTLWRVHHGGADEAIDDAGHELRLRPEGAVDLWCVAELTRQLLDAEVEMDPDRLSAALRCNLYEDLLPDWLDDEWFEAERQRLRDERLRALEALSSRCLVAGWYGQAVDVALAALRADP
jgi:DNA-binding SARP family transcriptional activator